MSISKLFANLILISISMANAINWQSGQPSGTVWSLACDFSNNDLSNKQLPGENCAQTCANTAGCTHFTWTTYNGGTCWMKQGSVSQSNAFSTNDNSMVCGIISSNTLFIYFLFSNMCLFAQLYDSSSGFGPKDK